jgi:TM2 domain-containing membrane protein YozV
MQTKNDNHIVINNIYFKRNLYVEKILLNSKGIYIISPDIDFKKKNQIANMLSVNPDVCYVFPDEESVSYAFITAFTDDDIKIIDKLLNSYSKDVITQINENGKVYIKHKNKWLETSDKNPDIVFYLNAFLGPFGIHKFYEYKILTGLFYLFTAGLCGIGCLLDGLGLILSVKKDKKGKLYKPLLKRSLKAVIFVLSIFLYLVIIRQYITFLSMILNSSFMTDVVEELALALSKLISSHTP